MQEPKKSYLSWAVDSLVVKPIGWGLWKLKESLIASTDNEQTKYVIKNVVAEQSRMLLSHVRQNYNNIISMDDLMKDAEGIEGVSRDGILIALHHLSAVEKSVYIEDNKSSANADHHNHKLLLKFSEPHQNVQPITEMERSIYNLEHTEKVLHQAIEKKEMQLNEVMEGVRKCVKDGRKQMAKSFLRKKHLIESDLLKTMNILDNVQAMLQRVHSSKNDKEIIQTYKMGSDAIKIAFADNGINLDNVHDVIEDMQEIYENQAEYETAISEPLRGALDVDDSELEKELMELMNTNEVNTNNAGNGGGISDDKKPNEMDLLDRELELRLKRLRSDWTAIDEPRTTQKQNPKAQLIL